MTSFLTALIAPLTGLFTDYMDKKAAEKQRDLAIIERQTEMARSAQDNNAAWEMANLQDKDKALRYVSYCMFTAPIVVSVVQPQAGALIFENLEAVPQWLIQTWIGLNGAVWGIASLKNVVPQIVSGVKKGR